MTFWCWSYSCLMIGSESLQLVGLPCRIAGSTHSQSLILALFASIGLTLAGSAYPWSMDPRSALSRILLWRLETSLGTSGRSSWRLDGWTFRWIWMTASFWISVSEAKILCTCSGSNWMASGWEERPHSLLTPKIKGFWCSGPLLIVENAGRTSSTKVAVLDAPIAIVSKVRVL